MLLPSELMGGQDEETVDELFFQWDNCGRMEHAKLNQRGIRGNSPGRFYERQPVLVGSWVPGPRGLVR